jgi:hypothetical protein
MFGGRCLSESITVILSIGVDAEASPASRTSATATIHLGFTARL